MSNNLYPRHDVNPKEKQGEKWLLQYAKGAYHDSEKTAENIFWRAATKYQELRDIALGKASTDKYKPLLGLEEGQDESHLSIDWSNRPVASKFRDIALSKIIQRQFRITATPLDSLARSEMDTQLADMQAKIMLKQQAMAMGLGEIAQSPHLLTEPGEPEDLEELEMKATYNMKLNVAIEAEQGIELVFYQNDIELHRKKVIEDLFDLGVGGYKEWIDNNGMVRIRACEMSNMLVSFCRKPDFSDAVHMGEIIEVPLVEISQHFTPAQMEIIANANKGRFGNPQWIGDNSRYNEGFDGFKCQVLDLEILSDDVIVYEKRVDKRGNVHTNKGKWEKRNSDAKVVIDGKEVPKYYPRTITNVYRVKWVIGTDLVYDYGLAHNMKREPSKKLMGRTTFSYHLFSYNYDNMRAQSMMERLRPLYDDYMMTHFKLQNLKNRMIPNGWAIDLDALESVDLKASGEAMKPIQVLEMLFQSGVLVYRGSTLDNSNPNRKPVEPIMNSNHQELIALTNELQRIKMEMTEMIGLNVVTDSSSPSDRMLNGVAAMAQQATNNALYRIMGADKHLLERAAKGVVQRLQIAVKQGDVEGIVRALGEGTVRHLKVTQAIAPHIWGIMIQDIPSDEERQMLLQQLNLKDAQGQVDPEDIVTVYNIHNIKEARQYLAYKSKKRKQEAEQAALQQIEANKQSQIESAQAAEQAKRETLQFEYDLKLRNELAILEKQKEIKLLELQSKEAIAESSNNTAIAKQMMSDDTKVELATEVPGEPGLQPVDDFSALEPQPEDDLETAMMAQQGYNALS